MVIQRGRWRLIRPIGVNRKGIKIASGSEDIGKGLRGKIRHGYWRERARKPRLQWR